MQRFDRWPLDFYFHSTANVSAQSVFLTVNEVGVEVEVGRQFRVSKI